MNSDLVKPKKIRRKWGDLPLRVKGIVVVVLPLAVLVTNSACTYILDSRQQDAERWVTHTLQVRVSIERVLAEFVRSNTVCRTYALTREDGLLAQCRQSVTRLDTNVLELRKLTIDNPSQTKRIAQLRPILAQRSQRLLSTAMQNLAEDKMDSLGAVISQRQILQGIGSLDDAEAALLNRRTAVLTNIHWLLSLLVPITLLCGISGGLAGTWLFLTGIVRRMAVIEEQVAFLAEGTPVGVADRHNDEIGRVAKGLSRTSLLLTERNLALSETNQRLIEQSERAKQASAAKSEFLARMSHEIRTPMNAICGMADLLLETTLSNQQDQYVRIFRNNSERLLTLINDILDLSKVEAGHLELESIAFDLTAVVDKTMDLLAPLAHGKRLELIADVASDVPAELSGDADRLQQILVNLIGNAIKFTQRGEVVMAIEKNPADPAPGALRFRISDTGMGIKSGDLAAIFEPFVQADSSITRKTGGTGLGLAITKRLVELMGGKIWAESEVGKGSTFWFTVTLPVESGARHASAPKYHEFSNLHALVVDDNSTNRLLLRRLLEQWHLKVDEAESGSEALTLLRNRKQTESHYDFVLIDRRMPAMDGFDTAEQICRNTSFRSPVVLMLASDTQSGDLARAREMGIHATLVKPIKSGKLASALQKAMDANSGPETVDPAPRHSQTESGIHILVAEDAEDNRFLINAYLEPEGYHIHMVENGAAAVESAKAHRYGLILMDIQMPIKDGYTATREIRADEAEKGLSPVPIIALSAHALKGEEATALEAGCTAYLAKPISKPKLEAEIERVLQKTPQRPVKQLPRPALSPEIQARVPTYLARRRNELQVISDLIEKKDFDGVRILGHNMKGSGAGYGFPELSKLGAEIEKSAKDGQHEELERQTRSLDALLSVFDAQIVKSVV